MKKDLVRKKEFIKELAEFLKKWDCELEVEEHDCDGELKNICVSSNQINYPFNLNYDNDDGYEDYGCGYVTYESLMRQYNKMED